MPVITSNGGGATAAINFAENGVAAVTTVTSTEPLNLGRAPTRSRGGADAAKFCDQRDRRGALTFIASPDFEAPTDAGLNNVYDVIVRATQQRQRHSTSRRSPSPSPTSRA